MHQARLSLIILDTTEVMVVTVRQIVLLVLAVLEVFKESLTIFPLLRLVCLEVLAVVLRHLVAEIRGTQQQMWSVGRQSRVFLADSADIRETVLLMQLGLLARLEQ